MERQGNLTVTAVIGTVAAGTICGSHRGGSKRGTGTVHIYTAANMFTDAQTLTASVMLKIATAVSGATIS